ncbi:hypothetical protein CKAH01_17016 [Colletotrichum kahawae]|uniref:Uncharacterized protein n=1 Tax=Colletotrichum kahawae TaxID=34407 RepID=A0AAE0D5E3_COLKA|nr:hypothetical protein CKAH01_17016 [Colletotrichum kahawae]
MNDFLEGHAPKGNKKKNVVTDGIILFIASFRRILEGGSEKRPSSQQAGTSILANALLSTYGFHNTCMQLRTQEPPSTPCRFPSDLSGAPFPATRWSRLPTFLRQSLDDELRVGMQIQAFLDYESLPSISTESPVSWICFLSLRIELQRTGPILSRNRDRMNGRGSGEESILKHVITSSKGQASSLLNTIAHQDVRIPRWPSFTIFPNGTDPLSARTVRRGTVSFVQGQVPWRPWDGRWSRTRGQESHAGIPLSTTDPHMKFAEW